MNVYLSGALLLCLPAASFWLSWPRRRWVSWAMGIMILALWAAGFTKFDGFQRSLWLGIGAWSLIESAYAVHMVKRNADEHDGGQERLHAQEAQRTVLTEAVTQVKLKGAKTEEAQKEALALYGMIKGLSEALSWEEVRPKLELAVRQYLGLEEFALYAADLHSLDNFHPLVSRRLGSSVGASWDTLARYLQERNIPLTAAHILESPERAVAVPIHESSEMMGYFYGRVPAGVDSKLLLEKAASFIDEIAFAFRRVKLFQEMERLSQIDGLTGLYRRGVLDQRLKDEVVRARTFRTGFCLMLMDVDHFKSLNDTYGHPFGDQVLKRVGELLKAGVYETDFVARYGGEEFCILLPRAEPAGVLKKAQAIRTAVEAEGFALAMQTVRITISIGIAHHPRDGATPEAVIQRADQALYYAKESGRNCVVDIADVPKHYLFGRKEP